MMRTAATKSRMKVWLAVVCAGALVTASAPAFAQNVAQAPAASAGAAAGQLTLKRGIELALQNSKDIQVAKLQRSLANRSAMITRSQFFPNLYAGSGAAESFRSSE